MVNDQCPTNRLGTMEITFSFDIYSSVPPTFSWYRIQSSPELLTGSRIEDLISIDFKTNKKHILVFRLCLSNISYLQVVFHVYPQDLRRSKLFQISNAKTPHYNSTTCNLGLENENNVTYTKHLNPTLNLSPPVSCSPSPFACWMREMHEGAGPWHLGRLRGVRREAGTGPGTVESGSR